MNRTLVIAALAALGWSAEAPATTYTAQITCGTSTTACLTLADLTNAAHAWANANHSELTYLAVFSINRPVAARFKLSLVCPRPPYCYMNVAALTTSDAADVQFDNQVLARAAEVAPIRVGIPSNSTELAVSTKLESILVYQSANPYDYWHWLNFTPIMYGYSWNFVDKATGITVTFFYGDTVVVTYPDGSQEKFQCTGGTSTTGTHVWHRVPGTFVPAPPPSSTPATPLIRGNLNAPNYWQPSPSSITITPSSNTCSGSSSLTVTAPDGSSATGTGLFSFC